MLRAALGVSPGSPASVWGGSHPAGQGAGPHGQILHRGGARRPWEPRHAGGGSGTAPASGDPRADAESPRGQRGRPAWICPRSARGPEGAALKVTVKGQR